jgi:acetyl-CoA synthetase
VHAAGDGPGDRTRFALYWEDESGAALGVDVLGHPAAEQPAVERARGARRARGDRVALLLPQRPETAIAYMAIFQMGAIALPLSHLFGPDALEYRLRNAAASVAIVEPTTLAEPARGARAAARACARDRRRRRARSRRSKRGRRCWQGEPRFALRGHGCDDPALIIYTSGTTGAPKGALHAHRVILGNIPGFVYSHDFFPQPGDLFWSPADWAWAGGLFDALLPSWYFGMPLLGYRGKFDAERAFTLLEKYGIRNAFLFPTALKLMMKAVPKPQRRFDIGCARS